MVKFDIREGKEPSQTPKFPSPLGFSPSSLAGERRALGGNLLKREFFFLFRALPSSLAGERRAFGESFSNAKLSSPLGLSPSSLAGERRSFGGKSSQTRSFLPFSGSSIVGNLKDCAV